MSIQVTLRLKDKGDTILTAIPENEQENCDIFLLLEKIEDKENPIAKIKILEKDYQFCNSDLIEDDAVKDKIDSLYAEILKAKKQGYVFDGDIVEETVESPYNPELIRIDSKTFSLRQIQELINDQELNLTPDFQRYKVWDNKKKSRLIESILLRIPLPVFYFAEDEEGKLTVVDGLQRLTAISEFMDNKLSLSDMEYLDCCNNKKYNADGFKLDDKYIRRFNTTQISVNIIDPQSPAKVKYDIFRRLNTGGMQLNQQEIRNCLASPTLRNTLKKMIGLPSFKMATGNMTDSRMQAQELALRFILFSNICNSGKIDDYSGKIDDELDQCVDFMSKKSDSELNEFVSEFSNAMENAYYLFGKHCFRKVDEKTNDFSNRSVLNKLLFVSWANELRKYNPESIKEKFASDCLIMILGKSLNSDADYDKYVSYGTNGWKNVVYAFGKATEIMDELKLQVGYE